VSLPREERLKALGLWPRWRRRQTPAAPVIAIEDETRGEAARPAARSEASDIANMDWEALREAVLHCTRCDLHRTRTQGVFGVGDRHAEWLIVGEAPGADEDRLGEPFVGQAGRLLDAMLAAIGLKRGENVYIANVLKSRPPRNRDPSPQEVAACLPYLERQIDLIQPKLVLAFGRFAAQSLLVTDTAISRLRGQVHLYRGIPLIVTYHPAYLLRNPADKARAWEDLLLAQETMARVRARGTAAAVGEGPRGAGSANITAS
jgi:uracil-DNA glycosylase family 4